MTVVIVIVVIVVIVVVVIIVGIVVGIVVVGIVVDAASAITAVIGVANRVISLLDVDSKIVPGTSCHR